MNTQGTNGRSGTELLPVLYELIDKDGAHEGFYTEAQLAAFTAARLWPDQEQDPDRTGRGWDVQVAGS